MSRRSTKRRLPIAKTASVKRDVENEEIREERIDTGSVRPSAEEHQKRCQELFYRVLKAKPTAVILFADLGEEMSTAAIGSEVEIRALHQEGTKALAKMFLKAHAAEEEATGSTKH